MNFTKHAITMSITAALALQSGFGHGLDNNKLQRQVGSRYFRGQVEHRTMTIAREAEPGDDRGGKGEPQPGDDRGRNKGKPRLA
jgi:uncharacterized protein (DUF342 family)